MTDKSVLWPKQKPFWKALKLVLIQGSWKTWNFETDPGNPGKKPGILSVTLCVMWYASGGELSCTSDECPVLRLSRLVSSICAHNCLCQSVRNVHNVAWTKNRQTRDLAPEAKVLCCR